MDVPLDQFAVEILEAPTFSLVPLGLTIIANLQRLVPFLYQIGLCVGVSKAALAAANAVVGDQVQLSITPTSS